MFDSNLLFSSAQVVTADAFSTNALDLAKTPAGGDWLEVAVTAVSGTSPTLDITCYGKATDASWATTDNEIGILGTQITAVGRYFFKIQSDLRYAKVNYDVGGTTPSFTVTCGIVSGPQQDAVV